MPELKKRERCLKYTSAAGDGKTETEFKKMVIWMKKRNARNIYKKQKVRKMLSVFITSVLLVCQILLTAGPLTVMEAWASRGVPVYSGISETAPEKERAGKFSGTDEYLTAGKMSEDSSDGLSASAPAGRSDR